MGLLLCCSIEYCGRPGCLDELAIAIDHIREFFFFIFKKNYKGGIDTMLSLRGSRLALLLATSVTALPQRDDGLLACGEAFYSVDKVRFATPSCMTNVQVLTNSV